MSRNVNLILICEDSAHEAFVRRYLKLAGWETRDMRVVKAPPGRGSGEQFVRKTFPVEISAYRSRSHQVKQALLVIIDGDTRGLQARQRQLDESCTDEGVNPRQAGERVAVFVPTWNVETWFSYLDGHTVDETKADYPRLARDRDCSKHAKTLLAMCRQGGLRQPAPPALEAACEEYRTRIK